MYLAPVTMPLFRTFCIVCIIHITLVMLNTAVKLKALYVARLYLCFKCLHGGSDMVCKLCFIKWVVRVTNHCSPFIYGVSTLYVILKLNCKGNKNHC